MKLSGDDATAARHELAWLLAGKPANFNEALALVGLAVDDAGRITEKVKPTGADEAREQRARARVLARSARLSLREQASSRLEAVSNRPAARADHRLLLAHRSRAAAPTRLVLLAICSRPRPTIPFTSCTTPASCCNLANSRRRTAAVKSSRRSRSRGGWKRMP